MNYFIRLWIAYSFFIIVAVPAYAMIQFELNGRVSHPVLDALHSADLLDEPDYSRSLEIDQLLPLVAGLVVFPPALAGVLILTVIGAHAVSQWGTPWLVRLREWGGFDRETSKRASRFEVYRRQFESLYRGNE